LILSNPDLGPQEWEATWLSCLPSIFFRLFLERPREHGRERRAHVGGFDPKSCSHVGSAIERETVCLFLLLTISA
jgi:hypothetical protein